MKKPPKITTFSHIFGNQGRGYHFHLSVTLGKTHTQNHKIVQISWCDAITMFYLKNNQSESLQCIQNF